MRHYASGSVRRDARQLSLPSSAPSRCRFLPVGLEVRFLLPQGVRRHFEEGQPGLPFGLRCFLGVVEATALSQHTATRRQGKIRGAGPGTLRDASCRATKALYPALSMCGMIFPGFFERHPRLTLAIVEVELAWAPNLLTTMDYTYRERHDEAIYRFKRRDSMLPSDFFHRNVVLSFQEDAIGIRLRAPV